MKYAVISRAGGRTTVLSTHRFACIASAVAGAFSFLGLESDLDIVLVDVRAQVLINVCEQRDAAMAQRDAAVEILHNLVSRDDAGNWTTVHDADTVVERQAEISGILA